MDENQIAGLIAVAVSEAKRNYHGDTSAAISNLHPLREDFSPEEVSMESLNADWSGAFAYHCAKLAGLRLPPRYPDPRVRSGFQRVQAWREYAMLHKIRLWHSPAEPLCPGDFVIFRLAEDRPELIGIVLAVEGDTMELAVGNYHNHSAVVERPIDGLISGFVRLP